MQLSDKRVDRLKQGSRLEATKLVYEWVKTGVINQKEFILYLAIIRDHKFERNT